MANGEVMNRVRSFLLEPTFANREGMAPEDVARRRAMAEALWSQGNSSQPVVGVFDGMNRVLQSFLGGRQLRKAEDADQFIRQREDQQQQAGLGLMADFAYPQAGTGTGSTTPLPAAPTFNQTYNAGSQNEWAPGDFPGGDTVPNAASRIAAYGVGDGFSVEGVDQTFATGFDRAAADYIAQGGNPADIRLYDVTRSAETQAQLHANYTQQPVVWNGVTYQPNVGPGVQGLAAPPGQSRHQTGAAADIGEGPFLDWMHQNAGQYGLAFLTGNAFTNDPGHVQLAANASEGAAADGGVGQFVRDLISNPQTRGVAAQLISDQITRLTTPPAPVEYGFTDAGDGNIYATNPRTGTATLAAGTGQPAAPEPPAFVQNYEYAKANGYPGTPEDWARINTPQYYQNRYDAVVGEQDAKLRGDINDAETNAFAQLNTYDAMEQLMNDPNFYSGVMAEPVAGLRRFFGAIGLADPQSAVAIENFGALANESVLKALGGSLGAQISNSDRSFLQQTVPNLSFSEEGNRTLLAIQRAVAQRQIDVAQMARDYSAARGGIDDGFRQQIAQWREANPLFPQGSIPGISAAPSPMRTGTPQPATFDQRFNPTGTGAGTQPGAVLFQGRNGVTIQALP